jgi:predicted transcriptional regulator
MEQNTATGRVQIHAHIEPEVRAELLEVARANDRSLAAEIRTAIREHVQREVAAVPDQARV